MDTLTFGTRTEARRRPARVRGIHRRLGGIEETTGRAYRVDDPDLLLWVHCCEVDSLLTTAAAGGRAADRRGRRPVRGRAGDRRAADRRAAVDVPRTVAELAAYFEGIRPSLAVTPAARDAYRLILLPPMQTWVR